MLAEAALRSFGTETTEPYGFGDDRERCPGGPPRALRVCVDRPHSRGPMVSSAVAVYEYLATNMLARDREAFVVLHLDARNRILAVEEVAKGHLTGVEVHAREVFKGAILSSAHRIIVAHNHPGSGDPEPSPQDLALTERLKQAGVVIGIPVVDHIIIGDGRWVSLQQRGLL